ncbi:hypothetical protein CDCA_CDCA08G2543 [Cyanidium caldarium]|uniref:diphthine methyl ester synthase n=1 Tax=Cyanidium caldarium TaxID=2771 RepID=A0AAV9IW56_CYACA|nr:hypothetical protein CDCA_CDCA08G2543 [Cyanidium caldarium]
MVFYLIGLGLGDEQDITLRGLETVRWCARVYLEAYTSVLPVDVARLERQYGQRVMLADREMVEDGADDLLHGADTSDVALLVVGDVFWATTHQDLWLRARRRGIECAVVHNAGIMNAVGVCGLQMYRFGETISLVWFTERWRPTSWYPRLAANRQRGLHTLCLLDIRVKEPTEESLARGKPVYEAPRFMSVAEAAQQLLQVAAWRRERRNGQANPTNDAEAPEPYCACAEAYTAQTLGIGLARAGQATQQILVGTLEQLARAELGPPLHALIIPGELHALEAEFVATLPQVSGRQ